MEERAETKASRGGKKKAMDETIFGTKESKVTGKTST